MAMPLDLVFVRHGESEANVVHGIEKSGTPHKASQSVYERPDWQQRLSAKGVQQAEAAGAWLKENGLPVDVFGRCYASTFMRARETALHIGGEDSYWLLDDRIKERDWGEYGATPKDVREQLFPYTFKNHQSNKWYARLNGGESLADNVLMRARDFIGTLHRDMSNSKVLVVSHGEFMLTMRYLIERMLPEEWLTMEEDAAQEIKNCAIIHYTRIDPQNPSVTAPHLSWMRMIYPTDPEHSPFGGQWRAVKERRFLKGSELVQQLHLSEPLIERDAA